MKAQAIKACSRVDTGRARQVGKRAIQFTAAFHRRPGISLIGGSPWLRLMIR